MARASGSQEANAPSGVQDPRRSIGWALAALAIAFVGLQPLVALAAAQTAAVTGTVYDSIARRPIAGASIEFVDAADPGARPAATTSDSAGRYSLELQYGSYLAGFFHPALDSLGLEAVPRRITVATPRPRVDLATPSPRTVMRSICEGQSLSDSTGLLIGHVRTSEDQIPVGGASVRVEWTETVIDEQGIRQRTRHANARAEAPGWFALCGVPSDAGLQARAFHGADSSGYIDIEVPANGVRHISFFIGGAASMPVASLDTARAGAAASGSALRGSARLTGTVLDRQRRPVVGAHALIWGTGLEAVTNAQGEFVLENLPGGTHTLEVRVIGYVPQTSPVHLAASRPATTTIVMETPAQVLSTVTVRGELVYARHLAEFDRRRKAGFGTFVTSEEIARRPNVKLSQLLQTINGVRVESFAGGSYRVTMQRNATDGMQGRGACTPSLFVDGVLDRVGDFDAYFGMDIAGIEVYQREAVRPLEFVDPSNPCGAIAIWTRPPQPKVKRDQ